MKNLFFTYVLLFISSYQINAQSTYKKSIFVDGTYLLSFLKTSESKITPINMKILLKDKVNLRFGFNLDNSTSENKGFEGTLMLGLEKTHEFSSKWSYGYGIDINSTHITYNYMPNTISIFSCIPFFAFEVYFSDEFSLVYEPKLFFNYYKYSDPDSFNINDTNEMESKLSGLSQFYLKFNF